MGPDDAGQSLGRSWEVLGAPGKPPGGVFGHAQAILKHPIEILKIQKKLDFRTPAKVSIKLLK